MNRYTLPELTFGYSALEPYIDTRTMEIHHGKHHRGYVDKLNAALEGHPDLQELPLEMLLVNIESLPEELRESVRNNGGGHHNHSLFWKILGGEEGSGPGEETQRALEDAFGSMDNFTEAFAHAATTRFGSGWAWLSMNALGELVVHSTPNQDSPLMKGLIPILGLDVWEHAYYLSYQNRRPDYIKAFWNIINWKQVEKNLLSTREKVNSCMTPACWQKAS